jgi:hypothetical protein
MYNATMKERMAALESEKASLLAEGHEPDAPSLEVLTHPKLAEMYRRKVEQLEDALASGADQAEAFDLIRSMIDRVVLTPRDTDRGLDAELHWVAANILAVCTEANAKTPRPRSRGVNCRWLRGHEATYTEHSCD